MYTNRMIHVVSVVLPFITQLVFHVRGQRATSQCQTIEIPMCKGLIDYNTTKLPNIFGHRTQTEVYWAMQPWWPYMDAGCSNNIRRFICGMYVPKCVGDGTQPPYYPCSETCRKAKVRCASQMRRESSPSIRRSGKRGGWPADFKCSRLLSKTSRRCVPPERERKKNRNGEYVLCQRNKLSMCRGISFTYGSLPNMFLQSDMAEIEREMQQYRFLAESGCSKKLRLFMCGAFMPFCVPTPDRSNNQINHRPDSDEEEEDGFDDNENRDVQSSYVLVNGRRPHAPFVLPCRELCQEVYEQCSGEYQQRTNGLPWPGKFHCHRYPSYNDRYTTNNNNNNSNSAGRTQGPTVTCTMPPFNYDGN